MFKKVGIILRKNKSISDKDIYSVNQDLILFLNKYENIMTYFFVIDDRTTFTKLKLFIDECDGIILPGGDQSNPYIFELIKYLYIEDKPTLGICLGMQELALFCDGKMSKLNTTHHQTNKTYAHEVLIDENSTLYQIIGKKKIIVNSRHNDYISYTKANRLAYSNDYIIEAIEIPNRKCMIGVQWHPESLYFDENSNKLFNYFIHQL